MICVRCANPMVLDAQSVMDAARWDVVLGRWYCVYKHDVWHEFRAPDLGRPVPTRDEIMRINITCACGGRKHFDSEQCLDCRKRVLNAQKLAGREARQAERRRRARLTRAAARQP